MNHTNTFLNITTSSKVIAVFFSLFLFTNTLLYAQCPEGDVNLYSQELVDNFIIEYPNCTEINGYLRISSTQSDVVDLTALQNITKVTGDLIFNGCHQLTNLNGLQNLTEVGEDFTFGSCSTLSDFSPLAGLETVHGNFMLSGTGVNNMTGFFPQLTTVGSISLNYNDHLTVISGFDNITNPIDGIGLYGNENLYSLQGILNQSTISNIGISGNNSLTDLSGLQSLTSITESVNISNNDQLTNLNGLNNLSTIGSSLRIVDNENLTSLSGLDNLTDVGFNFDLWYNYNLVNLEGISNLTSITKEFAILNNDVITSLEGLENLTNVETFRIRSLSNLTSLDGIENLNFEDATIEIETCNALTSLTGLENVTSIGLLILLKNESLVNLQGLENVTIGGFEINNNPSLVDLTGLSNLNTAHTLEIIHNKNLTSIAQLSNLTEIVDTDIYTGLHLKNNIALTSLEGLENLTSIGGFLIISYNEALTNIDPLSNLTNVSNFITISQNTLLQNIHGLSGITMAESITIEHSYQMANLSGLENLAVVNDLLRIRSLNIQNLAELNNITTLGSLTLEGNAFLTDLTALDNSVTISEAVNITYNSSLTDCSTDLFCDLVIADPSIFNILENAPGCLNTDELAFGCNDQFGVLSFPVFYDLNQNGIQDNDEPLLSIGALQITPGDFTAFPNNIHGGRKYLEFDDYQINYEIEDWQFTTPNNYNITLDQNNPEVIANFGLYPITTISDVNVSIVNHVPRCNQYVEFEVIAVNDGNTIADGTVSLTIDETITDVTFIDPPDEFIEPYTYVWNFENLFPGQTVKKQISLELPGPPEAEVGEWLSFNGKIIYNDANNMGITEETPLRMQVQCSYDPNDKLVQPSFPGDYALINEDLIYTVRFQNTGNAEAYDVSIEDIIDPNLDLSTFRVISSSHEDVLNTYLVDRTVTFEFENIFLPDSTTNFDESQGYVMYRIKPFGDLDEFSTIENTADIYFDNNPPVITNTTENNMVYTFDHDEDGALLWDDCDDYNASINPNLTEIPNNDIDENCDGLALIIDVDLDGFNSDEDCDDNDANINANANEIPNNDIDEDCNGVALIIDADGDGFNSDEDCDDNNPQINPGAIEIPNNDIDENCDGNSQIVDADGDGFNSNEDCDDSNANINVNATEIPNNNIDENCDGVLLFIDVDGDGYNSDEDCDDNNAQVNADATEIPNNNIDEDCDGIALIIDADMDGFNSDEDCDDNDAGINANATEVPNNDIDEDCNGVALIIDVDGDGFNSDEDCDDNNADVNANEIEIPNNDIDEDCDGIALIIDVDGDGFNSDEDCDDNNADINPNAEEIAGNDIDENCDGEILSTSISDIGNNKLKVYPNPFTNFLVVEQSQTMNLQFQLIDQVGKVVLIGILDQDKQSIPLDGTITGVYFLKIFNPVTQDLSLHKVVRIR